MDHNLDDSLNLDTSMGVEYETTCDTVVSQADITLDSSTHEGDIPMEFDQIEEQPILMDTGSEEIIVSDFMEDQFPIQEYSHQDQDVQVAASADSNHQNLLTSQSETMIDLKFAQVMSSSSQEMEMQPKIISVKAALPPVRPKAIPKKNETVVITTVPRQVAIAPKPSSKTPAAPKPTFASKQLPIAPKPIALVANRAVSTGFVKKVSLTGVVQRNTKGNVLAQIGKQLVMMPAGGSQKIKLVTACGTGVPTIQYLRTDSEQAQLIPTKNVPTSQSSKTVLAKVIVQDSNQPAVISKLMPAGSVTSAPTSTQTTSYVMQQKTVPISIHNKMIVTSPAKSVNIASKTTPKQFVTIKSTTPTKLIPATTSHAQGTATKKVVLTQNPNQKMILKTTAPSKSAQLVKDGNLVSVSQGQRSQLHQINIPGKGVQYIRLITPTTAPTKPPPTKTLVLTDTIGNLIHIATEKLVSDQPPSSTASENVTSFKKLISKSQQKLVRIAPAVSKAQPVSQQNSTRSSQSLLAPLSPMESVVVPEIATKSEPVELEVHEQELGCEEEEVESKVSLKALLAQTTAEHTDTETLRAQEVEVEFERSQSSVADDDRPDINSMDQLDSNSKTEEHPLIVIPSGYTKQQIVPERVISGHSRHEETLNSVLEESDMLNTYQSPRTPQALSDSDIVSSDLGLRPRKACNCTKSQCLKLYCDCFANGEFCNRCNCTNCSNNLENEELRQKAIRSCLDRNPNAFRPKIGKAKDGGLEIIRRHTKGCNCKRSGCLKNYCECFEAKIACTAMCKCVGCRNVEDMVVRRRDRAQLDLYRPHNHSQLKQPCSFMTSEVIEAVCQCLLAAAVDGSKGDGGETARGAADESTGDPVRDVIDEFSRCLQDIIGAAHQAAPLTVTDEGRT